MTAVNAAAAERGSILDSSRAVFAGVDAPAVYRIHPELSTFHSRSNSRSDDDILPWQHISVGLALAADRIARRFRVSHPVARAAVELNGLGGRS